MDMRDPEITADLARRLDSIATAEAGDIAHEPLSGRDIGLFVLTCVALVAAGALVVIL
ncbi:MULTISPECIES: hypothetical protein [unclassified Pseudoclavibacter]|uniref:hypothetical protein n=1 Tax=unclassified Pseudoclavibacter TaxID=2615177 RepID=UPI0012EF1D29|nr:MULTISPECIES: hypothetical protein [unclassified Pseudoclavibacter]MBF4459218.1 hypothetical protein [Pseudoclavibacter sp. VKM Ac-2867]VXC38819.1 conserved hypothetical protein [Pseudoclavibacter sp. 8L]